MPGEAGNHDARRYVVCRDPAQARKNAAGREAIVAALKEQLCSQGSKNLVGNNGYKRYLRADASAFRVHPDKIEDEHKFEGIWVLRTNTTFSAADAARKYKRLSMAEQTFRTAKGLLDIRPIFHKTDEPVRGHVSCPFLVLVLQKELFRRMQKAVIRADWA